MGPGVTSDAVTGEMSGENRPVDRHPHIPRREDLQRGEGLTCFEWEGGAPPVNDTQGNLFAVVMLCVVLADAEGSDIDDAARKVAEMFVGDNLRDMEVHNILSLSSSVTEDGGSPQVIQLVTGFCLVSM